MPLYYSNKVLFFVQELLFQWEMVINGHEFQMTYRPRVRWLVSIYDLEVLGDSWRGPADMEIAVNSSESSRRQELV